MEASRILRFAEDLTNWYWQFGVHRRDTYALSPVDWLQRLYSATYSIRAAVAARGELRPAMAVWGPSQTGKSTAISAYVDGNSPLTLKLETEGQGTGLHWPGGTPFRFMAPMVDNVEKLPSHIARRVLNPFNKGSDGSSCLTRFTAGSLVAVENRYHVTYPEFPVRLHLVSIKDLWHSIARGYGSECTGPNGRQTRWNLPRFQKELGSFRKQYNATLPRLKDSDPRIERIAFERLRDFVEVLEDLASIEEKDSNFYELSDNKKEWQSTLRQLLQEPTLLRSAELVEIFVSRILWDGLDTITHLYKELTDVHEAFLGPNGVWRNKMVFCSLEATAIFLNMSAPAIAMNPTRPNPQSSEGHILDLIQNLQWIEDGDHILIGCNPAMQGNNFGRDSMLFGNLQSLVWELTVPINLENLPDHPFGNEDRPNSFKQFIQCADLLDFAGVGNDRPSERVKLIADQAYAQKLSSEGNPPPGESLMTPINFFSKVLKRGKTASIVATYAKRLNIDGFSIIQGVRGQPCPNAGQLIQGIEFWWKYNFPEFYKNPRGKCPGPFNLILTWWSQQLNYAEDDLDQRMYDGIKRIVESLGILRDPEINTTFAIHDHKSPDKAAGIAYDFRPGSTRYRTLWSIKDFKQQFKDPISKVSFDNMILDKETGGAGYFFQIACQQMKQTRAPGQPNRLIRIQELSLEVEETLQRLLMEPELIPEARPKDTRRDHLIQCRQHIRVHLETLPEKEIKSLNFNFRELFNIRPQILEPVPTDAELLTISFIGKQYRNWVEDRMASFNPDSIGLPDKDSLKNFLTALVESVKPDIQPVTEWIQRFACRPHLFEEDNQQDLRPHLAVILSNLLLKGYRPKSTYYQSTSQARVPARQSSSNGQRRYYTMFLEPILGQHQRLDQLIDRQIIPLKRPPQPGDEELTGLTRNFPLNP